MTAFLSSGGEMRILLVEDEFLLGGLMAELLSEAGHRVSGPAASINEALAYLAADAPQAALVDLELRGGESGLKLASELAARGIPTVFVTGQPALARANRSLGLGLVSKPYLPATLVAVVSWLETAGQGVARPPRGFEAFDAGCWPLARQSPPLAALAG